jgi:hypothetical protein
MTPRLLSPPRALVLRVSGVSATGASQCAAACPVGFGASDPSAKACLLCQPGAFRSGNLCQPCPAGTFTSSFGLSQCTACGGTRELVLRLILCTCHSNVMLCYLACSWTGQRTRGHSLCVCVPCWSWLQWKCCSVHDLLAWLFQ